MSQWSSAKAKRVLAALLRISWDVKRESSSHKILYRPGWPDVVFAFHDKDEIDPKTQATAVDEAIIWSAAAKRSATPLNNLQI